VIVIGGTSDTAAIVLVFSITGARRIGDTNTDVAINNT
jgi:hypothetical protein